MLEARGEISVEVVDEEGELVQAPMLDIAEDEDEMDVVKFTIVMDHGKISIAVRRGDLSEVLAKHGVVAEVALVMTQFDEDTTNE